MSAFDEPCHSKHIVLMGVALLTISPADRCQLVKMLMTVNPDSIVGSNYMLVYLNIVQSLVRKTVTRRLYYENLKRKNLPKIMISILN